MKRYNRSSRRDRILELMQASTSHPTAYDIYETMKREIREISLGTVYRNLKVLAERGEIRKLECLGDFDRFDARLHNHYHFYCERCQGVFDLEMNVDTTLEERVRLTDGHIPRTHQLEFLGTCKQCNAVWNATSDT